LALEVSKVLVSAGSNYLRGHNFVKGLNWLQESSKIIRISHIYSSQDIQKKTSFYWNLVLIVLVNLPNNAVKDYLKSIEDKCLRDRKSKNSRVSLDLDILGFYSIDGWKFGRDCCRLLKQKVCYLSSSMDDLGIDLKNQSDQERLATRCVGKIKNSNILTGKSVFKI